MGRAGAGGSGGGHSSSHSSSGHVSGHTHSTSYVSGHHVNTSSGSGRAGAGTNHSNSSVRHSSSGYYYGPRRYYYSPVYIGGRGPGVMAIAVVVAVLLVFLFIGVRSFVGTTYSTTDRTKLDGVPAFTSACVESELDSSWIHNTGDLGRKLEKFYDRTGVQPYIYMKAYDPMLVTEQEKDAYAKQFFDNLSMNTDNMFMYVYFAESNDNDLGYMTTVVGNLAREVMDDEAVEVFWKYLDADWVKYDADETDAMFVDIFNKTSKDIMKKHRSMADVLVIVAMIALVGVGAFAVVKVIKTKRKAEAEKAAETERILNSGPHMFGEDDEDELTKKYDNMSSNSDSDDLNLF